jgi:hypothetical protein
MFTVTEGNEQCGEFLVLPSDPGELSPNSPPRPRCYLPTFLTSVAAVVPT